MMAAGDSDRRFDIVIAGGGMVGCSLAVALAPLGLDVAVIEAVPRTLPAQPSFDDRSTALSRSSQRMFEALGLWPRIAAAATAVTRIHVSDRGRFGFSHIDASQQHVDALGYIIINRVLGAVLQQAMDTVPGLELMCPARIAAVSPGPEQLTAELQDGRRLNCRLLVAADGAHSALRTMAGIGVRRRDYGQRAIIGNLLPEKGMSGCAFERFTAAGPLAMLPLSEGRAAFVWNVAEADAERVLQYSDHEFLAALQQAFGYRLGQLAAVGPRTSYRLELTRAERLVAQRIVLVGNAAHGLHPAAAQGFNLGLRDVASLCDCIADAPGDVGDRRLLQQYAEWRQADQRKLVGFTDGLVRLFGSRRAPAGLLRDIGMLGFDLVPGIRTLFARHTMGLAGRLPRLSRGVPLT